MNSLFKQETLHSIRFRIFTITILCVLVLSGVSVARSLRVRSQAHQTKRDALVQQVEQAADFPLRIQQDTDTPLSILEAKVKEISAADYEKLTSNKANSPLIVSAPEVRMLNVSNKTISGVMLIVDDVSAQRSTGIYMHHLAIEPGTTFTILPANFVKPEYLTSADASGSAKAVLQSPMKSQKFWLPFADKSQIQVRVSVEFQDGTKWFNKGQGGENQ